MIYIISAILAAIMITFGVCILHGGNSGRESRDEEFKAMLYNGLIIGGHSKRCAFEMVYGGKECRCGREE